MNHNIHYLIRTYRFFYTILMVIVATLLVSCQNTNSRSDVAATNKITPEEHQRIQFLLEEGDLALERNRLTTPLDDNAYLRYLQVLAFDPQNSLAEQGIANVVEKYLAWSIDAIYSGNHRKAIDYLNKARSVDENHPNIVAVENLITNYRDGGRKTFILSRTEIKEKTPETIATLKTIASDIANFNARVIIEAPSDPAARWIYQQLNNATSDRISAQFEMTSRVRIHLFY